VANVHGFADKGEGQCVARSADHGRADLLVVEAARATDALCTQIKGVFSIQRIACLHGQLLGLACRI